MDDSCKASRGAHFALSLSAQVQGLKDHAGRILPSGMLRACLNFLFSQLFSYLFLNPMYSCCQRLFCESQFFA